jgi:hypothetical protein
MKKKIIKIVFMLIFFLECQNSYAETDISERVLREISKKSSLNAYADTLTHDMFFTKEEIVRIEENIKNITSIDQLRKLLQMIDLNIVSIDENVLICRNNHDKFKGSLVFSEDECRFRIKKIKKYLDTLDIKDSNDREYLKNTVSGLVIDKIVPEDQLFPVSDNTISNKIIDLFKSSRYVLEKHRIDSTFHSLSGMSLSSRFYWRDFLGRKILVFKGKFSSSLGYAYMVMNLDRSMQSPGVNAFYKDDMLLLGTGVFDNFNFSEDMKNNFMRVDDERGVISYKITNVPTAFSTLISKYTDDKEIEYFDEWVKNKKLIIVSKNKPTLDEVINSFCILYDFDLVKLNNKYNIKFNTDVPKSTSDLFQFIVKSIPPEIRSAAYHVAAAEYVKRDKQANLEFEEMKQKIGSAPRKRKIPNPENLLIGPHIEVLQKQIHVQLSSDLRGNLRMDNPNDKVVHYMELKQDDKSLLSTIFLNCLTGAYGKIYVDSLTTSKWVSELDKCYFKLSKKKNEKGYEIIFSFYTPDKKLVFGESWQVALQ